MIFKEVDPESGFLQGAHMLPREYLRRMQKESDKDMGYQEMRTSSGEPL